MSAMLPEPPQPLQLYLLRHADAGDPAKWDGPDEIRPLSDKGRRQAKRLARYLGAIGYGFDAVISSPKIRAVETAKPVAEASGLKVALDARLAAPLGPDDLTAILADAGDPGRPVLVGHDPDFSELLAELIGIDDLPLRKGALARLDAPLPLAAGTAVLRWLVPPDLLKPAKS